MGTAAGLADWVGTVRETAVPRVGGSGMGGGSVVGTTGVRILPIGGGAGSSRSVRVTSKTLARVRLGVEGLNGGLLDLNAGHDLASEGLVVPGQRRSRTPRPPGVLLDRRGLPTGAPAQLR